VITHIAHIGIACHDLDATINFYQRTYGLTVTSREVNPEQGAQEAMLKINDVDGENASYLQLLAPISDDSPVARFLACRGEGVHHIAFGTADLPSAAGHARAQGVRVLYDPPRRGAMGSLITFLHPKDCGSVLTELVQTPVGKKTLNT